MDCQKIILLDNSPDQPSKFRARNWIEINDESRRAYNISKKIFLKIFKNCARFTNCISEINNTQIDDTHDIDLLLPM